MSESEIIEDFFGVYLLYCMNPKYKGRTYIGYTRDPKRRITQHNKGTWAGGAYRTNNKGPWKMVLIVHGFPNNISALRFEWAWQNPSKTIRLQHLNLKRKPRKESEFQFKLRILSEMLRIGPWCLLPLIIRWLEKDFYEDFPADNLPPSHMLTCYGSVKSRNLKKPAENVQNTVDVKCILCIEDIVNKNCTLTCLNPDCELITHLTCLADSFLLPGEYIPVEGFCPICNIKLKWGDLIRKMKGCSQDPCNSNTDDDVVNDNEINISDDDISMCSQDKEFVDNNSRWLMDCVDDLDDL